MHSHKLVSLVLAALLLAAPAALIAAPTSPRPAAAVSFWDAALAQVRALLAGLLPVSGRPASAHQPATPRGQQVDNCSNMDPNGKCKQ
jgi:hypothetical protein